jgi:hypothetical protein
MTAVVSQHRPNQVHAVQLTFSSTLERLPHALSCCISIMILHVSSENTPFIPRSGYDLTHAEYIPTVTNNTRWLHELHRASAYTIQPGMPSSQTESRLKRPNLLPSRLSPPLRLLLA